MFSLWKEISTSSTLSSEARRCFRAQPSPAGQVRNARERFPRLQSWGAVSSPSGETGTRPPRPSAAPEVPSVCMVVGPLPHVSSGNSTPSTRSEEGPAGKGSQDVSESSLGDKGRQQDQRQPGVRLQAREPVTLSPSFPQPSLLPGSHGGTWSLLPNLHAGQPSQPERESDSFSIPNAVPFPGQAHGNQGRATPSHGASAAAPGWGESKPRRQMIQEVSTVFVVRVQLHSTEG